MIVESYTPEEDGFSLSLCLFPACTHGEIVLLIVCVYDATRHLRALVEKIGIYKLFSEQSSRNGPVFLHLARKTRVKLVGDPV